MKPNSLNLGALNTMNMNIIEDKINLIWEGFIQNFSFNAPMHKLDFNIQTFYEDKKKEFFVTISEISFYLFYDQTGYEHRSCKYAWEKTELSTIFYEPIKDHHPPKDFSTRRHKDKYFDIDYNLHLELWDTDLLIKANKLKINDEEMELL